MAIPIRSPDEIERIGAAGAVLWRLLKNAAQRVRPGDTTTEIERAARVAIAAEGAEPIMLNYRGRGVPPFPGSASICINEQVVHAVPGDQTVRAGDLLTIDCAIRLHRWCADAAISLVVGEHAARERLRATAVAVLEAAIGAMAPGAKWSAVAAAAERVAIAAGARLIVGYDGHGIGEFMHEPPRAWFGTTSDVRDFVLRPGMVLTVEPIIVSGAIETMTLDDGWSVVTRDGGDACHEERTVAVMRDGVRVLTGG